MRILSNRWFLFFTISICFVFFVIYSQKKIFEIEEVNLDIEYNKQSTPNIAKTKSDFQKYFSQFKGQWIFQLPLEQVREWAEGDTRIETYAIRKVYPNKINVKITLKEMAIVYLNNKGRFFPMSVEGELLPEVKAQRASEKVILRGDLLSKNKDRAREAIGLVDALNAFDDMKESRISELVYNKKEGFVLYLNHVPISVKFGFKDLAKKAARVQKVIEYLKKQNVKSCVIDARLGKKVVVKLRNET